MGRKPSQLTQDIRAAIKQGMSNADIAEALGCTKTQVTTVRYGDATKNNAKKRAKQREYLRAYRARKKQRAQHNASTEVTGRELDALRNVPNPTLPITMESRGKYSLWERIRILFRGW